LAKNDNLRLALAVGDRLEQNNYEVAYTRTEDIDLTPRERIHIVNQEGGDLLISLTRSLSAAPNTLTGVEGIIYGDNGVEEAVANNINVNLVEIGLPSSGTIRLYESTGLLAEVTTPVVLELVGFINSDYDNEIFDTRFHEMVNAIASGIMQYFESQETIAPLKPNYRVQAGLYSNYKDALLVLYHLIQEGFRVEILQRGNYYSVLVGNYPNLDAAVVLQHNLSKAGYHTLLVAV
jgi:N-acetylmuramoyl-L-alanine amidase